MRAQGCSPTNARLQPYQSMHACSPIRAKPAAVPARACNRMYQERKAIIISTVRSSVGQLKL
jgi:hypothetical protein